MEKNKKSILSIISFFLCITCNNIVCMFLFQSAETRGKNRIIYLLEDANQTFKKIDGYDAEKYAKDITFIKNSLDKRRMKSEAKRALGMLAKMAAFSKNSNMCNEMTEKLRTALKELVCLLGNDIDDKTKSTITDLEQRLCKTNIYKRKRNGATEKVFNLFSGKSENNKEERTKKVAPLVIEHKKRVRDERPRRPRVRNNLNEYIKESREEDNIQYIQVKAVDQHKLTIPELHKKFESTGEDKWAPEGTCPVHAISSAYFVCQYLISKNIHMLRAINSDVRAINFITRLVHQNIGTSWLVSNEIESIINRMSDIANGLKSSERIAVAENISAVRTGMLNDITEKFQINNNYFHAFIVNKTIMYKKKNETIEKGNHWYAIVINKESNNIQCFIIDTMENDHINDEILFKQKQYFVEWILTGKSHINLDEIAQREKEQKSQELANYFVLYYKAIDDKIAEIKSEIATLGILNIDLSIALLEKTKGLIEQKQKLEELEPIILASGHNCFLQNAKVNHNKISFPFIIDNNNELHDKYRIKKDLELGLEESIDFYLGAEKIFAIQDVIKNYNNQKCLSAKSQAIILHGSNGGGKTTLGKYIAHKLGLDFLCVDCTALGTMHKDSRATYLKKITAPIIARKVPCVIVLDEADSLFVKTSHLYESPDEMPITKTVGSLLTQAKEQGIIVILTTNHLQNIGKTVKHRCTFILELSKPSPATRKELLQRLVRIKQSQYEDRLDDSSLNYNWLIKPTHNFAIRSLESLVRFALDEAIKEKNAKKTKNIILKYGHFRKYFKTVAMLEQEGSSVFRKWLDGANHYAPLLNLGLTAGGMMASECRYQKATKQMKKERAEIAAKAESAKVDTVVDLGLGVASLFVPSYGAIANLVYKGGKLAWPYISKK